MLNLIVVIQGKSADLPFMALLRCQSDQPLHFLLSPRLSRQNDEDFAPRRSH
jgi:hypothetical protein